MGEEGWLTDRNRPGEKDLPRGAEAMPGRMAIMGRRTVSVLVVAAESAGRVVPCAVPGSVAWLSTHQDR